jgi:predicted PurR-regulated permease PerM
LTAVYVCSEALTEHTLHILQDCVASDVSESSTIELSSQDVVGLERWVLRLAMTMTTQGVLLLLLTTLLLWLCTPDRDNQPSGGFTNDATVVLHGYMARRGICGLMLAASSWCLLRLSGAVLPVTLSICVALLHFVPVLGGWISVVGCMMPFVGLDPQLPSQLRVVLIVCMAVAQLLVPQVISLVRRARRPAFSAACAAILTLAGDFSCHKRGDSRGTAQCAR